MEEERVEEEKGLIDLISSFFDLIWKFFVGIFKIILLLFKILRVLLIILVIWFGYIFYSNYTDLSAGDGFSLDTANDALMLSLEDVRDIFDVPYSLISPLFINKYGDVSLREALEESMVVEEKSTEVECYLAPLEDGVPVVKASCDNDNIGFWYADKDGDITKIKARFRINTPEFGGEQKFEWDSMNYSSTDNPVCGFESSFDVASPPANLGGYETQIYIDIQLIDSDGNVSNTSSCRVN